MAASLFREKADPGDWVALLLPLASTVTYFKSETSSLATTCQCKMTNKDYKNTYQPYQGSLIVASCPCPYPCSIPTHKQTKSFLFFINNYFWTDKINTCQNNYKKQFRNITHNEFLDNSIDGLLMAHLHASSISHQASAFFWKENNYILKNALA